MFKVQITRTCIPFPPRPSLFGVFVVPQGTVSSLWALLILDIFLGGGVPQDAAVVVTNTAQRLYFFPLSFPFLLINQFIITVYALHATSTYHLNAQMNAPYLHTFSFKILFLKVLGSLFFSLVFAQNRRFGSVHFFYCSNALE